VKPAVPEVPTADDWHLDTVPGIDDVMHFQSIKDGAIFIENLVRQVKELTKPIELYSTRLSADKWFIWLDYYRYISDGTVRKYHPPKELFEWEWEYIKLRDNWGTILYVLQNILNNMRVLYTAGPLYSTVIKDYTYEDTESDECASGEAELTRNFYYPFYDDPVPTEAESDPPVPPVDPGDATKVYITGDIEEPYINSSYGDPYYHTDDNIMTDDIVDIENVKMVNPLVYVLLKISLSMRTYSRAVWFYCQSAAKEISTHVYSIAYYYYAEDKHIDLVWDASSPTTITLNTPGSDGTVAYAYFGEEPESDDPADSGYKLQIFTNHADDESVTNTPGKFPNNQKRNYYFSDGKLVLNPAWDWESYPVTFNVVLEFQAGNAGFEPVYAAADVDTFISPLENTDGHVSFGYSAWDTEWDEDGNYEIIEKTGSIQLNATQLYKQYGTGKATLKIGELYIDNDTEDEWDFSMSTDLAKTTLPHLWKAKLKTESSSGLTKWWSKIYRVTGTSPLNFEELEGETAGGYTDTNRYCLGRWGSISVWLKVIPDFEFFEDAPGVKAHKVPNLIGLTADDEDLDVPYIDDFITAWDADTANPQVFAGAINSQAHFDAPESRIISQTPPPDTILPYGVHDVGNEMYISYTVSAGYPVKAADLAESYDIPKITGMTLTDAIAYLATNYPTWEISEGGITYVYSYNVPEGLIINQTPDWQQRMTPWSASVAVSISLGLPDGKVIGNYRGMLITDVQTALDAINCDCPETHQIYQRHPTVSVSKVIAQIPSSLPYRLVPEIETKVGLIISWGPSDDGLYNTPVPTVIGRMIDDTFITDLEADGWDVVEIPVYCEGEPGLIVDQIPRYGGAMGILDANRLIVAVAHDQKSLVTEGAESGVKL
jgi:beta-lactam-binding protein with PASTA domain